MKGRQVFLLGYHEDTILREQILHLENEKVNIFIEYGTNLIEVSTRGSQGVHTFCIERFNKSFEEEQTELRSEITSYMDEHYNCKINWKEF